MTEVNPLVCTKNGLKHITVSSDGDARAQYRDLQTLYAISKTILDTLDVKIMMERILDHALELGQFDLGVICLFDPASKSMEPVASRGYRDPGNVEGHRKKMDAYTTELENRLRYSSLPGWTSSARITRSPATTHANPANRG